MKKPFLCRIWLHKWAYLGRVWFRKRRYYQCQRPGCGAVRIFENDGKNYYRKD